jgi:DNA-binding SARP family transcriptional activator
MPGTVAATRVHLLGRFGVTVDGREVHIPSGAARLIAFLALHNGAVDRSYAASWLWLDTTEARAHANLRSCLWRLRRCEITLVTCTECCLRLAAGVEVDLDETQDVAFRLVHAGEDVDPAAVDPERLSTVLLPGWPDDFVVMRRERLRQLCLHALERLAQRLHEEGATTRALEVAQMTVAAEPLRESAHRLVIGLQIEGGNVASAVHQFSLLRDLLHEELGRAPSPTADALMLHAAQSI